MLSIDWELLAVTLVLFLALIFILNQILYKPLLGFVDARNAHIAQGELGASQNSSDVATHKAEAERIIAEARAAAAVKKQVALNAAKEQATQEINRAKAALDAEFAAFNQTLDGKKNELKNELKAQMGDLKASLAAAVARI